MPFDEEKARRGVEFFEKRLVHTVGKYAGSPFLLMPHQRRLVRDLYGTVRDTGLRQYREVFKTVAKKNGKSEECGGFVLKGLTADGEQSPHIYGAASTRDQAALIYRVAASMVGRSRALKRRCHIHKTTKTIEYARNDGFYRAISADAGSWDGIQTYYAIADELHRWGSNRDLWDVLFRGMAIREQPLGIAITTAGEIGESELCWEKYEYARQVRDGIFPDESFYPDIFETPLEWDFADPGKPALYGNSFEILRSATGWYASNPALGYEITRRGVLSFVPGFLSLDYLRGKCAEAKHNPKAENSFRRFHLNQWVQQEERWLPLADWDQCRGGLDYMEMRAALRGQQCFAGLDLSSKKDLTALVLCFVGEDGKPKYLPYCWIPKEYSANSGLIDKIRPWIKAGLVETTEGNVVDYGHVRKRINELSQEYQFRMIGADPWNAQQLLIELGQDGFEVSEIRQGFASLSGASKEFEADVLAHRMEHGGHPVFRWNADCVSVKSDNKDNICPTKPDRNKSSKRIDLIAAAIMARLLSLLKSGPSVYETRGVLTI